MLSWISIYWILQLQVVCANLREPKHYFRLLFYSNKNQFQNGIFSEPEAEMEKHMKACCARYQYASFVNERARIVQALSAGCWWFIQKFVGHQSSWNRFDDVSLIVAARGKWLVSVVVISNFMLVTNNRKNYIFHSYSVDDVSRFATCFCGL